MTLSHDARGARTRCSGSSLPSHPVAALSRAAGPSCDSLPYGRTGMCTGGRQSDGYRAHQRPVDHFVGRVQPEQNTFSDQPQPGWSGWGDASRNTATFAVSREHRAGQPLPRKIMPGVDTVPTRAGLLIGLMVSLSGPPFTRNKKGFFSSSGAATILHVSTVPRWWIGFVCTAGSPSCSAYLHLSTPMRGSHSAADLISMRSHPDGASLPPDSLSHPVLPGFSTMR